MKKILFPTDFSDRAACALDVVVELANRLKHVQLTLYHAYMDSVYAPVNTSYLEQEVAKEMNRTYNRIRPKLVNCVELETIVECANTIPAICRFAEQFDLVAMGTQGSTGRQEVFLGSVTNGVVKKTQTPVLVFPNQHTFKSIENIVLALDNESVSDPKGVEWINTLRRLFDADLMLFHTEEKAFDRGIDEHVMQLFDEPSFTIDYNFIGKSVSESLQDMVTDYDVDLLCMVRRKRGLLANLFRLSQTSVEVFRTKIPLLILHDV